MQNQCNIALKMFAKSITPPSLPPAELDVYLANGWFRMNQTIFTTHFLQFNKVFYNAVWLRVTLIDYTPGSAHKNLLKKIKNFRVEVKQAQITQQHEALYEKYKEGISFDAYASLYQLLLGGYSYNIYNTRQVNIYDGRQLVASGFFDLGRTSAEGIVSIYDPAYRKYSLGKCLIYSKIDYCKQQGLQYFYPGYAVPGYAAFDYKLDIATEKIEYYHKGLNKWIAYTTMDDMYKPLDDMYAHLAMLQNKLTRLGGNARLLYYRFFDAILNITLWNSLLDYPVFILLNSYTDKQAATKLIIYNIAEKCFMLLECSTVYTLQDDVNDDHIFSNNILNIEKYLYATTDVDDMARIITQMF